MEPGVTSAVFTERVFGVEVEFIMMQRNGMFDERGWQ